MQSIIYINIPESTLASPLRFFKYFYDHSKLDEAKKHFISSIPDLDDEYFEHPPGACVSVNKQEQTWSIEFDEFISYGEYEFPIYQRKTIEYSFQGEIEKKIRTEFEKSWLLFSEKLNANSKIKGKKDLIRNFISSCLLLLDNLQTTNLQEYKKLLERPIRSLIRNCYTKYSELVPSQKINNCIGDILQERESSRDLYQYRGLKTSLINEISTIKNEAGGSVIAFENEHHKKQMASFLEKEFKVLDNKPINLIGDVGIVSYFLYRVITISGLTLRQADEKRFFTINSGRFISNYASTEKYRLTFRNEVLMDKIDRVIIRCAF